MNRRRQRGDIELDAIVVLIVLWLFTVAVACVGLWYIDKKLDKADAKTEAATQALGKEQQSRAGFQVAAQKCTDSVQALKAQADKDAEKAAADIAAAQKARQVSDQTVAKILAERPTPGTDQCTFAKTEADRAIDDRGAVPFK